MKIMDDFYYEWKPSHAYHKIYIFVMSKDKWDTKGKFMNNALYAQWYGKRYLSGWSNVKQQQKIKPIALAIVELCYSLKHQSDS